MAGFTPTTKKELDGKLDPERVSQRQQAGRNLSYIEGWWAIAEANRIFGFDGWTRETVDMLKCGEPEQVNGKWRVRFMAKVRVTVLDGSIVREGTGYGSGIAGDLGDAYEGAIKEAETDAMKRALMTFGNKFGLALYDKTQANVCKDDGRLSNKDARESANKINLLIDSSNTVEEVDARFESIKEEYWDILPEGWLPKLQEKYEVKRDQLQSMEG